MEKAIIGRKLGMTQIFDTTGLMIPVTVVQAGPMTVIQKKTVEKDGYEAIKIAFEDILESRVNKPIMGQLKKANVPAKRILKELRLTNTARFEIGGDIKCDIFNEGDVVDVSGKTRGRGFTGAIQRWNQHRLKMTHGTGPVHRSIGSTGANSTPSKVIKGLHMAGQYGNENVTIQNLVIVKVDLERNVLLVSGAVPGPKGGLVYVKQTIKAK